MSDRESEREGEGEGEGERERARCVQWAESWRGWTYKFENKTAARVTRQPNRKRPPVLTPVSVTPSLSLPRSAQQSPTNYISKACSVSLRTVTAVKQASATLNLLRHSCSGMPPSLPSAQRAAKNESQRCVHIGSKASRQNEHCCFRILSLRLCIAVAVLWLSRVAHWCRRWCQVGRAVITRGSVW